MGQVKQNRWYRMNTRASSLMLTGIFVLVIFGFYGAGLLIPQEAVSTDFIHAKQPPSWQHLFGTDNLGRDLLMRTLKGMSVSVTVGIVASCISALIGVLIGIAAAAGSRFLDSVISWVIDLMMGIPHTVLIILISFALGRGLRGLLAGIAATHWTSLARLIRGEVMQLRSQHYIAVSRRMGKSGSWIMLHHFLPQLAPQFLAGLVLMFLGYGLPPEQPAVGIILAESMTHLSSGMWWMAVFPGMVLVLMVWLIDRLGETLRQWFV